MVPGDQNRCIHEKCILWSIDCVSYIQEWAEKSFCFNSWVPNIKMYGSYLSTRCLQPQICMMNAYLGHCLIHISSCFHQNIHNVSVSITTSNIQWTETILYTVESPNNGHFGTRHFVLYREVVLSSEVKNVLV